MSTPTIRSLAMRTKAWELLSAKPMTSGELGAALKITEYRVNQMVAAMLLHGTLAKMPSGRLRSTDKRPKMNETPPRSATLDTKPRSNGTTPLRVPNSVWQWWAFV